MGSSEQHIVSFNDWAELAATKKIVNPIFIEYSKHAYDTFWEEIIKNMAHSKFPPKFKISNNKIYYGKINEKSPNIELTNDIEKSCIDIINFLKKNGKIFSPNDHETADDIVEDQSIYNNISDQPITWPTAKKAVKECLVSEYVCRISKHMMLSAKQKEQLREIVNCNILSKNFGKDNIIIENNTIQDIQGLYWDDVCKIFYLDNKYEKANITDCDISDLVVDDALFDDESKRDNIPQFTTKFKKYLQYLQDKV